MHTLRRIVGVRRRLAGQSPGVSQVAVDLRIAQAIQSGGSQYLGAGPARGHDGHLEGCLPGRVQVPDGSFVCLNPMRADQVKEELVFAIAEAVDGVGLRRIVLRALRQSDIARREKRPDSLLPGFAVDIFVVVGDRVERLEPFSRLFRTLLHEAIEGGLPGHSMDPGRLSQDSVEIEEAGRKGSGPSRRTAGPLHTTSWNTPAPTLHRRHLPSNPTNHAPPPPPPPPPPPTPP